MYCRNCGEQIADGAAVCVKCGFDAKKGTKFCSKCGKPTRIAHKILADGSKVRVCKNDGCGEEF